MTTDDLTRRAIIAAHNAHCARGTCGEDVSTYLKLNAREQAIVALWRADRDVVFREAEAHALNITERAEKAEAEVQRLHTVTGMADKIGAQITAERNDALAAIERVREYADLLSRSSGQRPEVVAVDVAWAIRHALDGTEPDRG